MRYIKLNQRILEKRRLNLIKLGFPSFMSVIRQTIVRETVNELFMQTKIESIDSWINNS